MLVILLDVSDNIENHVHLSTLFELKTRNQKFMYCRKCLLAWRAKNNFYKVNGIKKEEMPV